MRLTCQASELKSSSNRLFFIAPGIYRPCVREFLLPTLIGGLCAGCKLWGYSAAELPFNYSMLTRAEHAAAALNDLVYLFSEEDHTGLHEVVLDYMYFTAESSFKEFDPEGETDLDEESASEERETSKFNPSGASFL